jgi:hypothetical protein
MPDFFNKVQATIGDGPNLDGFGRVRTSQSLAVFECQLQYDKHPLLWHEKIVGTASATHLPNESALTLAVGSASGDRMVRQTVDYFRYQPGKSQLVRATGVFGAAQAGTTKLIGYGDDDNGLFFGQDGDGVFLLLRSKITGTVSDARKVYQAQWNLDGMDGSGRSGHTLDPTKAQIFTIDFQWLAVGRVRFGFVINGCLCYVHEFDNANVITSAYMTTANLPIRYEIVNTAATAGASSLKQICCEVESENGQLDLLPIPFGAVVTDYTVPAGYANREVIFAARPKTTFQGITNRGKFVPKSFTLLAGGGRVYAELIYNPTVTGTWADANTAHSIMEQSLDVGTNFTGGVVANAAISAGSNQVGNALHVSLTKRLPYGLDIDGANPTTLALAIWTEDTTVTADIAFEWEEVR